MTISFEMLLAFMAGLGIGLVINLFAHRRRDKDTQTLSDELRRLYHVAHGDAMEQAIARCLASKPNMVADLDLGATDDDGERKEGSDDDAGE